VDEARPKALAVLAARRRRAADARGARRQLQHQNSPSAIREAEKRLDAAAVEDLIRHVRLVHGRGLHSSTFRLNVSTFCRHRLVHGFPPDY
jgi:hypothetical protein